MSIDDGALRDPRVLLLAKRRGWNKRETLGALLEIWAIVYDRASATLSQLEVDAIVGEENFSCDLAVVGLATLDGDRVRIAGASDRIEYLSRAREAGKSGGINSGKTRGLPSKGNSKGRFDSNEGSLRQPSKGPRSNPQGSSKPNTNTPVPDSASAPDPVPDKPNAPVRKMAAPRPTPPHRAAVIETWHRAFALRTGGNPTWGDEQRGAAAALCLKHPEGEIARRIENYFAAPPDWPKGQWDWLTFVKYFDKCAVRHGGAKTPLEMQLERVQMLEEQEREQLALAAT